MAHALEAADDALRRERLLVAEHGAVHFAEPAVEREVRPRTTSRAPATAPASRPGRGRPRSGRPSRCAAVTCVPQQARAGRRGAARVRISGSAASASNQWNAWATVIASSAPSANGSSSAVAATDGHRRGPRRDRTCAHPLDRLDRDAGPRRRGSRRRVSLPVPAARSTVTRPGPMRRCSTSHATASGGYEGRVRS